MIKENIKSRSELKEEFSNNKKLTQQRFSELIDSMLSLKDDHFRGVWKHGTAYYKDDVVIYNNTLWVLDFPENGSVSTCSREEPGKDPNWEMLTVKGEDDDWKLLEESGDMYALNERNVGIGTKEPEAKLEVTDGKKGRFSFNPDTKKDPVFTIVNLDPRCNKNYLSTGVGVTYAVNVTDAPEGFLFVKGPEHGMYCKEEAAYHGKELVLIKEGENGKAQVGIGTLSPEAMLHATDEENGALLFHPKQGKKVALLLKKLADEEGEDEKVLETEINKNFASWTTDTKGFLFKRIIENEGEEESDEACETEEKEYLLVAIRQHSDGQPEVGIGTKKPEGMLDITDKKKGQFLFSPQTKKDPVFSIINLTPECNQNYLATGVGKFYSTFVSDASKGFAFKKGGEYGAFNAELDINQGELLMVVQEGENALPQVGIGIKDPRATLDVNLPNQGWVKVLPQSNDQTLISLANISSERQLNNLLVGINSEYASFIGNADKGFVFKKGEKDEETDLSKGDALVTFRKEGQVGIGTTEPVTMLDITNNKSGIFHFNLNKKPNPSMCIGNLRPGKKQSYLTTGVGNTRAIWVTDAPDGFVFKRAPENSAENEHVELDINQGDALVHIVPKGNGKMGIGAFPDDNWELDVSGKIRAFNLHLSTNENTAQVKEKLGGVMEKLMKLTPVKFEWKGSTPCAGEGQQIGLMAHDVDEQFSELIKHDREGNLSVAYQNMVAVLVKGMQEQQEMIAERDEKIANLEAQVQKQNDTLEAFAKKVEELEKRIDKCEG
ncbi:tail fiber domain-containing protein [Flammeovirgaceae bacterium SG7u.111]|nr:tail fiber domain-containing protein [Flammeovirgaceae bacterium SG7u.132]WPO36486.1 tail fiber domain-containing protein [Flammeovirgaceae bacterium SG7u.111]